MPWTKGQSGNPNGRARKTRAFADLLRQVANRKDEATGQTNKELIAEKIINLAKDGDVPAARLFYEYTDGKPLQQQDITLRGGLSLAVIEEIVDVEEAPLDGTADDNGQTQP